MKDRKYIFNISKGGCNKTENTVYIWTEAQIKNKGGSNMNENLQKLLDNEELMKGIAEVETTEELAELFKKNNIELAEGLTMEDALRMVKEGQNNDELVEEDLEDVSGGIAFLVAAGAVGAFVLAGTVLTFIGGYAYQKYKNSRR